MTNHHVQVVVVSDGSGVVQQLLNVVVVRAAVILLNSTTGRVKLSVVGVVNVCSASLVEVDRTVQGQHETGIECKVSEGVASEGVTLEVTGVQTYVLDRVSVLDEGTVVTVVHTITVVHHFDTVRVDLDATVSIADVSGIDRSHLLGECEDVTGRSFATVVTQCVVVEAGVVHVCTNFQPLLGLIVSLHTSGETLHVTLAGDTLILQVTQ